MLVAMATTWATLASWGLAVEAAQARRPQRAPARRPAPPPAPPVKEAAQFTCPNSLGEGATTRKTYCDVLTALEPTEGVRIPIPAHRGEATLFFDLHNRHTYSEEQVRSGRGYARITATIRVVPNEGEELAQAVIQTEFRTERDLLERILGGAGPGGLKAVAPTGVEPIVVTIPEAVTEVYLVGQRLVVEGIDRREQFGAPGRPIATVSSVMLEYRPSTSKPAPGTTKSTPATAKPAAGTTKPSAPSR